MIRTRLVAATLLVLLGHPGASRADEPSPRPMTVEDLWSMDRVGSPDVSPDGRWVAFTVSRYSMEENEGNTDLWLVPTDASAPARRLTWNEKSDSGPVWSPDGTRIAFLSSRGEGPSQLHVLRMDGGEAEPVTDLPMAPVAPRWLPDGKRIVFLASTWPDLDADFDAVKARLDERKEDETGARITDTRLLRYWDHYLTDGRYQHLFVLDLESREVRDLLPGSELLLPFWSSSSTFDISADGEEITFSANSTAAPYRTLNFDLYTMPTKGGEPNNITRDNPAFDLGPRYSPDGRYLLYSRNRRPELAPDFAHLARRDRESGAVVELAVEHDSEPTDYVVTPDGKTVLFHAQKSGRTSLFTIPIDGGNVERLNVGGSTGSVRVGPDGLFVYTTDSIKSPARLMVSRLDRLQPRPLTDFNQERLVGLDLGRVEDVTFAGAGGEDVQMFLVYPPGFDPARKWPLLLAIHGGPHGAWRDSFHYRWNLALFAAPGHVVAAVNFHGSTGFGQGFAESILGAHADKPYTDLMKATDYLTSLEFVDERRMAAAGGSYGGYMVSWILGHTDRFAALINHAGVYDLMGQFASDWTWGRPNNYGAAPWEDPARIDQWSPSRFAESFNTPTLILHGEKDYRVPYTQGLNLHGVLSAKGVPSRVVVFPDENHWILKPQSAKLWWSEVHGWLDRYLGDTEKPDATE